MELGLRTTTGVYQDKDNGDECPTVAYFDPKKPTTVSADASSYCIGGVLLQESDGKQHPVAFCSRTLTPTEQQYAQIERECLACVWSYEKCMQYLRGHSFRLITVGTTNRRKGLEYGAIEVSTSPDAYDVVQSEARVRAKEAASRR